MVFMPGLDGEEEASDDDEFYSDDDESAQFIKMDEKLDTQKGRNYEWDYRWMDYPLRARDVKHPSDQSVAIYKGHSVLCTLIRCYFSPEYSTGQRYMYTGSHDSCVYVYDLVSGARVARLVHHKSTIRDCSWHPNYPMLVSSSFDGDIAKWEFPGNGEKPIPVNNNSRPQRQYFDWS